MVQSSVSTVYVIVLTLGGLGSLLAGLYFLARGLRPPRKGSEPRCSACEYIVAGIESDRCPECGAALTPYTIVHGQIQRRPRSIIAGLVLLLVFLAILGQAASPYRIDWYHLKPTSMVVTDMKGGSLRAWAELMRRQTAGELSAAQQSAILDAALDEQAATQHSPLATMLLKYLGQELLAGNLSPEQKRRLMSQAVQVSVAPATQPGFDSSADLVITSRRAYPPQFSLGHVHTIRILSPDGTRQTFTGHADVDGAGSGIEDGSATLYEFTSAPGTYDVEIDSTNSFYNGSSNPLKPGQLVLQSALPTFKQRVVIPASAVGAPVNPAKVVSREELDRAVREAVSIERALNTLTQLAVYVRLSRPLPAVVAFDVIARSGKNEYPLGQILVRPPRNAKFPMVYQAGMLPMNVPPLPTMDIIVRGAPVTTIAGPSTRPVWNGELTFPDEQVDILGQAVKPRAPTTARVP